MKFKSELGRKIYSARKELNLTQEELGSKVGVSRAAISQFELGDTVPSISTLNKLIKALNCDLAFEWQESQPADKVVEQTITLQFYPIHTHAYLASWVAAGDKWLTDANYIEAARYQLPVLRLADFNYEGAFIVEVKGNSMMPRYPHGSRYVASNVVESRHALHYLNGVYMILQEGRPPLFRRIVSTTNDRLVLRADATGEEIELSMTQVEAWLSKGTFGFFKLGQAIHLPPEE